MKAFIIYNLDTRLPVAVGEAIKAEWARIETAEKMKIRPENLIAEEVTLSKLLNFRKSVLGKEIKSNQALANGSPARYGLRYGRA